MHSNQFLLKGCKWRLPLDFPEIADVIDVARENLGQEWFTGTGVSATNVIVDTFKASSLECPN
jgi:hypothetical protein